MQPLLPQPSSPNNPNRKFCPLIQEYQSHRQYRIILSADTASEVRQLLGQKRR